MENSIQASSAVLSSMSLLDVIYKPINIGITIIPLWLILIAIIVVVFMLCKNGIFDNFLQNSNMLGGSENDQSKDSQDSQQIQTTTKLYNFNTSWCGHSVNFQPIWDEFSKETNLISNLEALDVKCDNEDGEEICDEYNVKGFPTIILEKYDEKGEPIRITFTGERTLESLTQFRDANIDN